MPVLAAYRVGGLTGKVQNLRMSNDLSTLTVEYWLSKRFGPFPTHTAAMRIFSPSTVAAFPYNLPVSMPNLVYTSSQVTSYRHDYYFRIHIVPRRIDFGNVVGVQREDVVLWNAYFDIKQLTRLDANGAEGISFEFDPALVLPRAMPPLWGLQFKIVAAPLGPPTINETLTAVVGGLTITAPLTGRRIVLFPFPPNWASPFDETFVYKTNVLPAANGSEQTLSQWGNRPRLNMEYNVLLRNRHAQKLDNLLFAWQGRFFGVVLWSDRSELTAVANENDLTIYLDTTTRAFAPGGFVTLWESTDVCTSYQILSVAANALTITSPIARTWAVGTRVYPSFAGLINASLSGVRLTDQKSQMPVAFECEPSTTFANTGVGGATPTYRGEELYLGKTNWAGGVPFGAESDRQKIDVNAGKFYSHTPSGHSKLRRLHRWFIKTRADAVALRAWIGRREGMARPVYMPSGFEDFTLAAPIVTPAGFIDVVENEYGQLATAHPARRDILVLLRDGTYYARRIISSTQASDGVTRIELDTPIVATIQPAAVKRISFLGLYRQASDASTIRWLGDVKGTAEIELVVKRTP